MKKSKLLIPLITLVLITLVTVYFYSTKNQGKISDKVISDFAIEDTSLVHHIIITDFKGRTIDLKRNNDHVLWTLNDSTYAKEYSVNILLKTFKKIYVMGPVHKAAKEQVIRNIAGSRVVVQIFDSKDDIIKTYYIGSCTQGQKGTYMVLENSEGVRSSEPVITNMKGFIGCLRQRFFTTTEDWLYTGIFDHPNLDISKVTLKNNVTPEQSFSITYAGGNNLKLIADFNHQEIPIFDTLTVKDYLLLYKKVHFETLDSHLSESIEDSLKTALPMYTISVFDNNNKKHYIDIHPKPAPKSKPDWPTDRERMYGVMDGTEVGLIQTYVFDPLIKELSDFSLEKKKLTSFN